MRIITTQTTIFMLILLALCVFFYNVAHLSASLVKKTNQDKITELRAEVDRLTSQLAEVAEQPCEVAGSQSAPQKPSITKPGKQTSVPSGLPVIPILVMACNRDDYLRTTLSLLFQYKPADGFPVIVSQGCGDEKVARLLSSDEYKDTVVALQHHRAPNQLPYFAIAQHYGWALKKVFDNLNYEAVIILEDDMEISVDFFEYFASTYPILRNDPSLYCVSSWNDNGMDDVVRDSAAIHRTDVFPGLGWMMERSLWREIGPTWTEKYWDEYMREPKIRKNRACLYPEISRNRNIGQKGTSEGQFWEKIARIKFNEDYVNFTALDLSHLYKEPYDSNLLAAISAAQTLNSAVEVEKHHGSDLRLIYENQDEYINLARFFRLMDDEKNGLPRTSYKKVVIFHHKDNRVFLTPETIPE